VLRGQFALADVRALSLGVSPFTNLFELARHLLDDVSKLRQLRSDGRNVFPSGHAW
jgi:hypothetical protein